MKLLIFLCGVYSIAFAIFLAISGSTRRNSTNHSLIKAIADLSVESLAITVFDGIVNLPPFNPDNDGDHVAKEVVDFRQQLNNAGGVIICTPEYAHGGPVLSKMLLTVRFFF